MKILVDMNLSPNWVGFLRRAAFEPVHWSSVGPAKTPDIEIMSYAKLGDFVVLTHDLDFGSILAATGGDKPSVVQIRAEDVSVGSIGSQVVAALRQMQAELQQGALLTIDPSRTRMRILPLKWN